MDDYRHRKELFYTNLNGTTLFETGSLMITICATYFLCQILKSSIQISHLQKHSFVNYLFEYVILIIPMIFVCTFLSSISAIFHILLWSLSFIIYLTKTSSPVNSKTIESKSSSYSYIIENFRGQMVLVTCLCILAVDFPIFPRRYAKTENYGYSGMDLGVGLFAIAHGMVSSESRSNKSTTIKNLFLENFILLLLGLIRFISVKYFSYVEHVSEYGVHWNFFLTLCFMKLFGNFLLMITKNLLLLILLLVCFHEFILLNYFQYDHYLIDSNNLRTNFFDANREGIYSLPGYISLYLLGIYMGRLIINNEFNKQYKQMFIQFIISMFVLCFISYKPSRKLCNLSYITSTTGLACMCISCFSLVQWLLERKGLSIQSILLKNVNQKGLDVFLLGNVLTGIINLNVKTIDTPDWLALCIIMIYLFIISAFAYFVPSLIKLILRYFKLSK